MEYGLSVEQVAQFHDDGFLIVRDQLPKEAYQPFVDEVVAKIDEVVGAAVDEGLLDPGDTFPDASFETRLALGVILVRSQSGSGRIFRGRGLRRPGCLRSGRIPLYWMRRNL